jgi:dephospho-CoA kinase
MTATAREDARAPVLGITGGLASGKSTVAGCLAKLGAEVIDADRTVHRMLRTAPLKQAIRREFGSGVFAEDGEIDRRRLAEAAFGEQERVEELNRIVHPPAIEEIDRLLARYRRGDAPLVVLDAPLLMETGLHEERSDALLFVSCPRAVRERRAAREGISPEQFRRREEAQLPAEVKMEQADYVVENSGSIEELEAQVQHLWPELCSIKRRGSSGIQDAQKATELREKP